MGTAASIGTIETRTSSVSPAQAPGSVLPRTDFSAVLSRHDRAKQPPAEQLVMQPARQMLERELERVLRGWEELRGRQQELLGRLPADVRPLMETQLLSDRLHLQVQLLTRAADAFAGTVRRISQLGGG